MISNDTILGLLLLFETGFGALGNSFLLGLYTITYFIAHRLRPIDLLLSHLAFVNDLVLLSKGIPQTMAALGLNNFLDDVGCKFVFYFHRVTRGISLCTTCFLSGYQAITLCPRSSRWAEVKARIPECIVPFFPLCWTFHLVIYCYILLTVKGPIRIKNITDNHDFIYCSAPINVPFGVVLYVLIFNLPDVLCVGIMMVTSGYMIFVLYRHHQKVQYIQGNSLTSGISPETRATQTILLLVGMFVSFYSLHSVLALHMYLRKLSPWLVHTSAFLTACFPMFSPFILIVSDSQVPKYSIALWNGLKLPVQ